MNPSLTPPFHELGEYPFQDLCCDLFAVQEGIATCNVYGKRGQGQGGIDLLAKLKNGFGVEVGQCKCYATLSPREIRNASAEFFEHLAHWRERNVKRFILFVASELRTTQQQEEVLCQTQRFMQAGITYEAWDANTLRQKLAPHAEIVTRHIQSEEWHRNICGETISAFSQMSSQGRGSTLIIDTLGIQIERLSSGLSKEKAKELEETRELYRLGQHSQAFSRLEAFSREENWLSLEKPLRAKALRLLAIYGLNDRGDIENAESLATQARTLDPEADDSILRTLIVYHRDGPSAALNSISAILNIDTFNFRLALLLQLNMVDEVLSTIAKKPDHLVEDAETNRLHAWALLVKGDIEAAQRRIHMALTDHPAWQGVRFLSAIVGYFSSLSPAVAPHRPITWPEPIDWSFVKRDEDSLIRLRRAEEQFHALASSADPNDKQQPLFTIWRLACLTQKDKLTHSIFAGVSLRRIQQILSLYYGGHQGTLISIGKRARKRWSMSLLNLLIMWTA
jgi:tetratricopeptide (TPR) repeat protein